MNHRPENRMRFSNWCLLKSAIQWAQTLKSESYLPNNESDKSVHLYLIMIHFISSVWVINMSHIVIAKTATSSHYRTFTICKIRNTNQKCHQIKLKYSLIHGTCNSKTYHQNYSKKCIKFRPQHFSNFLQKSQFRSKLSIFDWDFSLFSLKFSGNFL